MKETVPERQREGLVVEMDRMTKITVHKGRIVRDDISSVCILLSIQRILVHKGEPHQSVLAVGCNLLLCTSNI